MNTETIIEVFNETKIPHMQPDGLSIYGEYKMKLYAINGRPYFKKSNFPLGSNLIWEGYRYFREGSVQQALGIWWTGNSWIIGNHSHRGQNLGLNRQGYPDSGYYAKITEDVLYPHLAQQKNIKLFVYYFGLNPQFLANGNFLGLRCKQAKDIVQMNISSELHLKLKTLEKRIEALQSKNSYKDVELLLSENSKEGITFKSLQFSIMASNDSNQAIIDAVIKGKNDSKKAINDALKIWHTDKFFQKFGHRIAPIEEARIKEFVKTVTQALTSAK